MPIVPAIPPTETPVVGGIHPITEEAVKSVGTMSGEWYAVICLSIIVAMAVITISYLVIYVWGNPIMKAASSRKSGKAIIQHFQNSKVGVLLLASINCGAIRHNDISEGTLITTPYGINSLTGHTFVNSWNIIGISLPTFLIGGVSKLRELGIHTRKQLEYITTPQEDENDKTIVHNASLDINANLITEAYNFDNFEEVLYKHNNPKYINLQIEHVGDFIESVNQHYTESEITKEVKSYTMGKGNGFAGIMMITAIAIFLVAIALYVLMGAV